jgi:hypothetical protein
MKMKKDDLKEVIAENGFLEHYKSVSQHVSSDEKLPL